MNFFFSSCKKLYIPENIDRLFDAERMKTMIANLHLAVRKLEEAMENRRKVLEDLSGIMEDAFKTLTFHTDKLLQTIEDLQRRTKEKLDIVYGELKDTLKEQRFSLRAEATAANTVLRKINRLKSEGNNKSQNFVWSILAEKSTQGCNEIRESLKYSKVKSISFQLNACFKELIQSSLQCESLGEVLVVRDSEKMKYTSISKPYRVVEKTVRNVRVKDDMYDCWVTGSCASQDGTILLADYGNTCLKRLPQDVKSIVDSCVFSYPPSSVCIVNEREAAVTLSERKRVQFVSLGKTMNLARSMQVGIKCNFIAHRSDQLYLSDKRNVYVYTLDGQQLRSFSSLKSAEKIFSGVYNIAVSQDGRTLYVTDWNRGLIAMDLKTGHLLWKHDGENLINAAGVCVDGKDSVFVCGVGSNNVLQFNKHGKQIEETVTKADGISCPLSVCFDQTKSQLVVSQGRGFNDVVVFVLASVS